jgi:hypothetical protein
MRLLFRWKGIRALAHLVRRHLYWAASVEIDDFDEDLRFYCHLNEHIGSFMYWRGSYSLDQHWLAQWYRLEVIVAGGRTRPLDRWRLKNYQNILCQRH